ncbi:hypothetical protein HanRHA438_Chr07g0294711 [Helianthus annuus]|nr:hypothetical protein HanRHA438_Chr07g0294711 [Helianthus annuus]
MDWFRNLRIVLKQEKISYVLDDPIPDEPNVEDVECWNLKVYTWRDTKSRG